MHQDRILLDPGRDGAIGAPKGQTAAFTLGAVVHQFKNAKGLEAFARLDFPLRNVLPKPIQKPHPPLWVACSQLETIEMAGRCGIGALGFQFLSAEMAHAWVNVTYISEADYNEWAAKHMPTRAAVGRLPQ